jgi:hypothetical protein
MKQMRMVAFALAFAGLVGLARAEEKNNPTGTWKWEINAGGQTRQGALKLKLDGDKLTGAVLGRDNQETPIEDAKYKDGELSFKVTRERDGQKFVMMYKGKITGDTLKGKIEFERDGQTQSRDWEAKRSKD